MVKVQLGLMEMLQVLNNYEIFNKLIFLCDDGAGNVRRSITNFTTSCCHTAGDTLRSFLSQSRNLTEIKQCFEIQLDAKVQVQKVFLKKNGSKDKLTICGNYESLCRFK